MTGDAFALLVFAGGALLGCGIGLVYFLKAERTAPAAVRVGTSAFGPAVASVFLFAVFLWPDRYRYNATGVQFFYWLQALPLVLLVACVLKYPGPRRLHIWLVPLGLLAWAWTFALGWLAVHGE